jgi:hypothetical protein
MLNKKIYIWSCDLEMFRGEGVLAWLFIRKLLKFYKNYIIVESFNKKFIFTNSSKSILKNKISRKLNFFSKYALPYWGIVKCWKYFLLGYRVVYVNYLPLWNPLTFILLPPNTILGPITGGIIYDKNFILSIFIRKYIIPNLYKLTLALIKYKKKILFSTSLLKQFANKEIKKKSIYNFSILQFTPCKIKTKKKNDLIIYFRNHKNKSNNFLITVINKLIQKKISIIAIGDYLPINGVKNNVNISRNKTLKLIKSSRYAVNSGENSLSLFALDCISNSTRIFCSKKNISSQLLNLNNVVIPINFENIKKSSQTIYNHVIKKEKKTISNYLPLIKEKRKVEKLIKNYFIG